MRSLYVNQYLNAAASLLQDTVDQEQSICDKVLITIDPLDDLKEQSDVVLSFPFLLNIMKH